MGQKQKTEKKEKEEKLKVGNNNGQLRIANATSGGARKAVWANFLCYQKINAFGSICKKIDIQVERLIIKCHHYIIINSSMLGLCN